ncbi:MAG: 2-dehydropantoate 2-reductase [Microbacterium sp.]|nr:2-dehydropantoate 2-reductase [Microbacterium sp.]MBA4346271.1 2-dehydropantoate 2-reductase [Microbacterium sp.]
MTDLAGAERAAGAGDHVVARETLRLVDEEQSSGHEVKPRLASMRIAVIGAGAVGGLVAALAARAGHEVLVTARGEHADAIARAGLRVDGGWGEWVAAVELVRSIPNDRVDLIVLATKAHDSAEALAPWAAHDGTPVLVLQNGLGGEDAVRDALPHSPVAIGLALFAVSLTGPGHITVTGPNGLTLGGDPAAVAVAEPLLLAALPAKLVLAADIRGAQWTKLLINQVNALPAITGLSVQQTIADPAILSVLARGMVETVAVGDAAGVAWGRIGAVDADAVARVREGGAAAAAELAQHLAAGMGEVPNPASMLQSIRRGRTTEVDAINGAIVDYGTSLGIPTPVNAALVDLVRTVQKGVPHLTAAEALSRLPAA